jgi:GT2 family glycosyltransferase
LENTTISGNQQQNIPSVAVVILNWNGRHFLQQFLPSVMRSTYPKLRIIVADNASTDDSVDWLRENYPAIQVIQNLSNEGFAKGYNTALRQVQSDYYVLLNSDVEVTPGWIEPVIRLMETDEQIGACQPKILSQKDPSSFEYAGASGGWIDRFGYPFAKGRVFEYCEKDLGQYDKVQPCFWASGAAMFVRTTLYHEMKGLDEHFFAHQEEIDFCWRLQLWGYKVFTVPEAVVYHVGGGTLPAGNSRKVYLNFRNNLIMMSRNLPFRKSVWIIPVRLALDGLAAWRALFSGDAGFFFALIKAHIKYVQWLVFGKRWVDLPKKKSTAISGMYKGSIVWDYFVKGRKRFSEIVPGK